MAGGGDAGGAAEDGGEDEGVQRAPGVELAPVDLEVVRGGVLGEAAAGDPAALVVFGVGVGGEGPADLVGGAAGGLGDLLDGHGSALGEKLEERAPQPGAGAGGSAAVERGGQPGGELLGLGVHGRGSFPVVGGVGQPAQQESLATSEVKVWAASFNASAMVR
ncbi:hypothetical protein PSD17_25130 [Pseudonocardia sp. D17]|nr:hypothetical protein PSD17_25130 [Pseudonocardia sp. D17]